MQELVATIIEVKYPHHLQTLTFFQLKGVEKARARLGEFGLTPEKIDDLLGLVTSHQSSAIGTSSLPDLSYSR